MAMRTSCPSAANCLGRLPSTSATPPSLANGTASVASIRTFKPGSPAVSSAISPSRRLCHLGLTPTQKEAYRIGRDLRAHAGLAAGVMPAALWLDVARRAAYTFRWRVARRARRGAAARERMRIAHYEHEKPSVHRRQDRGRPRLRPDTEGRPRPGIPGAEELSAPVALVADTAGDRVAVRLAAGCAGADHRADRLPAGLAGSQLP